VDINPAALVEATAGRDKGKLFAVIEITGDNYLLVCDGKNRKVENPKRKNPAHVRNLGYSLELIKNKLNKGNEINNSDIRKSIIQGKRALGILKE